ncbi:PBSX family phage terminase large subunit, partial [Clostridium perfringens]|nr:PBSX family phage terminase large subunit [Clostridium perfringens]
EWGIADGLVYENFTELEFDVKEISKRKGIISAFGLDFGYTNDPTAFICCLVDEKAKELFIFDEHYQKAMSNTDIVNMIKYKGYSKEKIIADSAEPKSIDD